MSSLTNVTQTASKLFIPICASVMSPFVADETNHWISLSLSSSSSLFLRMTLTMDTPSTTDERRRLAAYSSPMWPIDGLDPLRPLTSYRNSSAAMWLSYTMRYECLLHSLINKCPMSENFASKFNDWKYSLVTGRIAAYRQTAGIVFTHRPKIRFFDPQGRLVAPIQVKLCMTDRRCKISPQSPQGSGNAAPKISKNFHFLVKSRPTGATPLTDFQHF